MRDDMVALPDSCNPLNHLITQSLNHFCNNRSLFTVHNSQSTSSSKRPHYSLFALAWQNAVLFVHGFIYFSSYLCCQLLNFVFVIRFYEFDHCANSVFHFKFPEYTIHVSFYCVSANGYFFRYFSICVALCYKFQNDSFPLCQIVHAFDSFLFIIIKPKINIVLNNISDLKNNKNFYIS